jgi:hypothetical protein
MKGDRDPSLHVDTLIRDVTTTGRDIQMIHLFAVSAAFKLCFKSYMPHVTSGGPNPYDTVVAGRGVHSLTPLFTLMWTMMRVPREFHGFQANHVVLLAERINDVDVDVSDNRPDDCLSTCVG